MQIWSLDWEDPLEEEMLVRTAKPTKACSFYGTNIAEYATVTAPAS